MKTKSIPKRKNSAQRATAAGDAGDRTGRNAAGVPAPVPSPRIDPRWRWHYRTLTAIRDRLMQDTSRKLKEAAEPIEAHSMHAADSATDEFEHDVALTLLAREENALCDVNDAITRILEGRYGICELSGAAIRGSRLRALPWCRFSVEAERRIERAGGNPKCRVPDAVSLRGKKADLPATGTITRVNSEGPREEPVDRDEAKGVEVESSNVAGGEESDQER